MKKHLLLILIGLFTISLTFQADPKEKAKTYFEKYNSKNKMNALILKSFPKLEDAKKIFNKPEDAVQFMKLIEATEQKMKEQATGEDAVYATVDINTFTIKDIKEGKTNFNKGLLEIIDKFKPSVRFFTVKLESDNILEQGFSYIYWMNINNKWVFVSRPNLAFRK